MSVAADTEPATVAGNAAGDDDAELRCPVPGNPDGMGKLLGKLHGRPPRIVGLNLIELSCPYCAQRHPKQSRPRVLHRFNLAGELIETVVIPAE